MEAGPGAKEKGTRGRENLHHCLQGGMNPKPARPRVIHEFFLAFLARLI